MTRPERSEVTAPNTPTQYFEITATPEQLEQLRQQHAWKINYQYIDATPFIQTAAQRSEVTDPPHVQQLRQDITTCQHLTKTDPTRYYQGLAEGIQRALDILGHTQEQK